MIGHTVASLLEQAIGLWGAWAFATFLAIAGVVFIAERILVDNIYQVWDWFQAWQTQRREAQMDPPPFEPNNYSQPDPRNTAQTNISTNPAREPLWKRLIGSMSQPEQPAMESRSNLVSPNPPQQPPASTGSVRKVAPPDMSQPKAPVADPVKSASASKSPPATNAAQPDSGFLQARIIGGEQEWRIPKAADMLDDWERQVDNDSRIRDQGKLIQHTLSLFGVPASFEGAYKGPAVTQYLIKPGYIERTVRIKDENNQPRNEVRRTKVKVSKIAGLANDLALALAASNVRIEAPIPGTSYVGVEVPNQESNTVGLKELMESEAFKQIQEKGKLPIALGEDVKGNAIVADLGRMPHLLIAGATGTGKSAGINSMIACLLLTHTPDTLRFLMVDPKMVELSIYNGIPHLLSPVVTEVDKAAGVLFWAVKEMERRYTLCSKVNARDLERYNTHLRKRGEKPLPYIVVIVDEMADLMMAAPEEVEKHVCRLAQMARAVGIHLIIATQRPSVDVITGLIKANFPSRISLAVTSQIDSRVILDVPGAERLLGRGDMLFMAPDASKLERLQGTWVGDDEIHRLVRHWKGARSFEQRGGDSIVPAEFAQDPPEELINGTTDEIVVTDSTDGRSKNLPFDSPESGTKKRPTSSSGQAASRAGSRAGTTASQERPPATVPMSGSLDIHQEPQTRGRAWTEDVEEPSSTDHKNYGAPPEQVPLFEEIAEMKKLDSRDELFEEAVLVVQEVGRGSVSLLQRKLRIGYNRASRLVDQLEEAGILGPDQGGSQGRQLLVGGEQETLTPRVIGGDTENEESPRIWM